MVKLCPSKPFFLSTKSPAFTSGTRTESKPPLLNMLTSKSPFASCISSCFLLNTAFDIRRPCMWRSYALTLVETTICIRFTSTSKVFSIMFSTKISLRTFRIVTIRTITTSKCRTSIYTWRTTSPIVKALWNRVVWLSRTSSITSSKTLFQVSSSTLVGPASVLTQSVQIDLPFAFQTII